MQISSKNKKILVFSDPHQAIGMVKRIIAHEKADYNICCGDWIDSHFLDTKQDAETTAKFLRLWVFDPKNITCIGNHDLPYFYFHTNKYTYCSGYSESKNSLMDEIWGDRKWDIVDKYRWYLWIDDFLISHAGLNIHHVTPNVDIKDKEALSAWLDTQIGYAQKSLFSGLPFWIFNAGRGRGGSQPYGGMTWQDYWMEFEPIPEIKQIFGHTCQKDGKVNQNGNSYCIDTMMKQYLIIQDGKLEIKNYSDIPLFS